MNYLHTTHALFPITGEFYNGPRFSIRLRRLPGPDNSHVIPANNIEAIVVKLVTIYVPVFQRQVL